MMMEGIDTLTAVTAIFLSPVIPSSDFSWATRAFSRIGIELIAAMDFTPTLLRVRSHKVRKAGGPAEMKCAEPERRASFMTAGPPMLDQETVTLRPASSAYFSMRLYFCIMCSGRKPTPPAPRGIFSSVTSARATAGAIAIARAAINALQILNRNLPAPFGVLPYTLALFHTL